jgi:predicted transcriptional regulator
MEENKDFWSNIPETQKTLLSDPELLYKIKCELDRSITGEDKNKLLLYLVCASSYTKTLGNSKWNLSAIITGSSSAGKSWLLNNVAKYFKNVEDYTRLTGAAPDRLAKDFNNKILIVQELRGTESAQSTLRVWISEGKLKLLTTDRDEKGRLITNVLETKGSPTFVTTCTEAEVDTELLNRIFILSMDESVQQTRNILKFEARLYRELGVENGLEPDEKFVDLPAYIQFVTHVLIPYIDVLAEKFPIPKGKELSANPRRDFKKLIFLIGVITWLHQMQRWIVQRGPFVFAVSSVADFYMAWRLCEDTLRDTILKLTERHKWVLNCFQEKGDVLTVRDVAVQTGLSENRARELLNSLVRKGYLLKDKTEKVHKYVLREKIELDSTIEEFVTSLKRFEENKLREWLEQENYKILLTRESDTLVDPLSGERITYEPSVRVYRIISKLVNKQEKQTENQKNQENTSIRPIVTSPPSFTRLARVNARLYPHDKCALCGSRPVEYQITYPNGEWGLLCASCGLEKENSLNEGS